MSNTIKQQLEFTQSLCQKILPIVKPLLQLYKLNVFGYRKFFPDGTSFNTSSDFTWTKFVHEKFDNVIIPNYEDEVRSVLEGEKSYFCRIGEPSRKDVHLSTLYDFNIWNTLSFYRKSGECIDGFYFASTRDNHKIIDEYVNNVKVFERFSFYFKDKFADIISAQEIKKLSHSTVSSQIFELTPSKKENSINNFLFGTPIHKLFLNINGQDVSLSVQEFRCLALLSRGKTFKEIGRMLNLSPRTAESYVENIKHKANIRSSSDLIDLFSLNFYNDKDILNCIENLSE